VRRYHGTSLASKSPEAISSLLQESKGALYEIGIADDGTFIGLEEDELEASLDVLRSMAEKLGASVTVTRKVFVKTVEQRDVDVARAKLAEHLVARARGKAKNGRGKNLKDIPELADYEIDPADAEKFHIPKLGATLWVAEALIKPYDGTNGSTAACDENGTVRAVETNPTQQLRISLTGPTTCGKSTLLGTLTTGDLDNGRGKSRLSLLRHRHELVSGVTSSVAWEIVGYKAEASSQPLDEDDECGFFGANDDHEEPEDPMSRVVNYATGNISSWTDIHSAAEGGRIVFMSDSAGQLKYRRTTVRSLVGWAPHYAALLVPANDTETEDGAPGLSEASRVHMELCIKLRLPLIVVFTKMDIASKPGLRAVLSSVLSTLKASGKKPLMLQNSAKIKDTCAAIAAEPEVAVPIVFTSSVKGDGINLVHELLMNLPTPAHPVPPSVVHPLPHTSIAGASKGIEDLTIIGSGGGVEIHATDSEEDTDAELTTLFHVEEVYGMKPSGLEANSGGSVISGHVRYGKVSIGDKLTVGPFYSGSESGHRSRSATPTNGTPLLSVSVGTAGMLSRSPESGDESPGPGGRSPPRDRGYEEEDEWRLVRVVSVRRLRLPVTTLFAGEAGTIGIIPIDDDEDSDESPTPGAAQPIDILEEKEKEKKAVSFEPEELRLKKGLVIVNRGNWMKAYTGFSAVTDDPEAKRALVVGADVIVYIASVRTVARIVAVDRREEEGAVFGWEEEEEGEVEVDKAVQTRFACEFLGIEWVELGAKVLVMKNRATGGGMEVFVGTVGGRCRV
jgi:GTPase